MIGGHIFTLQKQLTNLRKVKNESQDLIIFFQNNNEISLSQQKVTIESTNLNYEFMRIIHAVYIQEDVMENFDQEYHNNITIHIYKSC